MILKENVKKLIICKMLMCPFGLKKFDNQCNICRAKDEKIIDSEVSPILINVENEFECSCYKNDKLPLHGDCPFGFKEVTEKCVFCARMQKVVKKSETKEVK